MTNPSSALHTKAAHEHEATAKLHHNAAEHHDHNKIADAKTCSKNAMDACNNAQKHSASACASTAK